MADPDEQDLPDLSDRLTAAQFGVGLGVLVEAWLRDVVQGACALLSLGVVLAVLVGDAGTPATVAGAVVALAGTGASFLPLLRRWGGGRAWLTYLAVAAADLLTLVLAT